MTILQNRRNLGLLYLWENVFRRNAKTPRTHTHSSVTQFAPPATLGVLTLAWDQRLCKDSAVKTKGKDRRPGKPWGAGGKTHAVGCVLGTQHKL